MDYKAFISRRITKLREAEGVSARKMSLDMGHNINYINHIENGRTEPSLEKLIHICDYLRVSPQEFFDEGNPYPAKLKDFVEDAKRLDDKELAHLSNFIKEIISKRK